MDLLRVIASVLLLTSGVAAADDGLRHAGADAPAANFCIGGLEDGKLIPRNGEVTNQFRETSELGCTVDGGEPVVLPDLMPLFPEGEPA